VLIVISDFPTIIKMLYFPRVRVVSEASTSTNWI